jgi:Family of unknown function (DUF6361)
LLFPATSTIQTRARYFLFIPWIYQELERRRTLPADIERLARRDEIRLIHALEHGGETDGIIGTLAQDKLASLPSSIYWAGLGRLGSRGFALSQEQYHREGKAGVWPYPKTMSSSSLSRYAHATARFVGIEFDRIDPHAMPGSLATLPSRTILPLASTTHTFELFKDTSIPA